MRSSGRLHPSAEVFVLSYQGKLVKTMNNEDAIYCITEAVCKTFKCSKGDLMLKSREREIAFPRQICHYYARKLTTLSLSKVGSRLGKKNHATVLHSCKTYQGLIDTDPKYRAIDNEVRRHLSAEQAKMGYEITNSNSEDTVSNWEKIKHKYQ